MEGLWQDTRFAARKLSRQPGFTIAALLTLALGIGASAVLFTLVNAILLREPAGVTSPDRLVWVHTADYSSGPLGTTSFADFADFRNVDVFDGVAAFAPLIVAMGTPDAPSRVGVELISDSYFKVLGVPLRGRSFTESESNVGAPVAVVSTNFWRTRMASAPDAIGRTIQLNGTPMTVIGIAADGFRGSMRGVGMDAWIPLQSGERIGQGGFASKNRGNRGLNIIARMKPGVTRTLAQRRMDITAAQMFKAYPEQWVNLQGAGRRISVVSERESRLPVQIRSQAAIFVIMLTAIAALVLLICCANVAGLMIARATGLSREMGIRISIGASRARIARLLMVESIVLALVAAGIALFTTMWIGEIGARIIAKLPFPIDIDLGVDHRVILFTAFIALVSAILFGAVPAIRSSRADPATVIKTSVAQVHIAGRRISFRNALVTVQVASSVVLLVTALLFLRSMRTALHADLGFTIDGIALMDVQPSPGYRPSDDEALRTASSLAETLRGTAGIRSVTWSDNAPLSFDSNRRGTTIEGYVKLKGEDTEFHYSDVGPDYFGTMGIRIVRGRDISAQDRAGAAPVVVVNEQFANRYWKGDAIGKRLSFDGEHFATVVGIARDAHLLNVGGGEIPPHIFVPMLQDGWRGTVLAIRTDNVGPERLKQIKESIQRAEPRWQVMDEKSLAKQAESSILPQRVASAVLTVFGSLALFLAAIGLYGVIAYAVAQRTHEFGIRFALGATTADVLKLMLGQGLRVVLMGALIGIVLTAMVARALKTLLLGLSPLDPVSFIAAPLLLVMVGTAATLLPARRAARVDPLKALRSE